MGLFGVAKHVGRKIIGTALGADQFGADL